MAPCLAAGREVGRDRVFGPYHLMSQLAGPPDNPFLQGRGKLGTASETSGGDFWKDRSPPTRARGFASKQSFYSMDRNNCPTVFRPARRDESVTWHRKLSRKEDLNRWRAPYA